MTIADEIIYKETQRAVYEEQCFQHQEQPNEDYYECMNDYLDGTMNVQMDEMVMVELIRLFNKTFGVNSVGCPWGSCTEDFLLSKSIETLEKSEIDLDDENNLAKLFNENMYHSHGMYSNGKHAGKWYINIIEEYFKYR